MRAVDLSVVAVLSLVQRENLGEPHPVFAGGERYVSPRFGVVAERGLRAELDSAGLGVARDFREYLDMVSVVQRATTEFYGWVTTTEERYGVLVAGVGRRGVVLVRSGDTVRLEWCAVDRLVSALVWRLPDVGAGRGEAVSVRHADFFASSGGGGPVMRRGVGARPEGVRRLEALLAGQRSGVSKIYAAVRDGRGVRRRSARWVTVLDLVGGRWVLSVAQARQEWWVSAVPGSPSVVGERLGELARTVR